MRTIYKAVEAAAILSGVVFPLFFLALLCIIGNSGCTVQASPRIAPHSPEDIQIPLDILPDETTQSLAVKENEAERLLPLPNLERDK